jgi:hypothetical protein
MGEGVTKEKEEGPAEEEEEEEGWGRWGKRRVVNYPPAIRCI